MNRTDCEKWGANAKGEAMQFWNANYKKRAIWLYCICTLSLI